MMPVTSPPWSSTALGDLAHQADRAAAVHQADAVLGQDLAERARGFDEGRIGAGAGAAIDADFSVMVMASWHVRYMRQLWREISSAADVLRRGNLLYEGRS